MLAFDAAVPQDCDVSESIGYRPRQFRIMLAESGPAEACRRVIITPNARPPEYLSLAKYDILPRPVLQFGT